MKKPVFAASYRQGGLAVELILCHTVKTNGWITSEMRVGFCDLGKKINDSQGD